LLLLTPDGRISRYFYGVEFPARDIRLGWWMRPPEKSARPWITCCCIAFKYDPSTARYSATILGIVRLGGLLTIVAMLIAFLIFPPPGSRSGAREFAPPRSTLDRAVAIAIVSGVGVNFAPDVDSLMLFLVAVCVFLPSLSPSRSSISSSAISARQTMKSALPFTVICAWRLLGLSSPFFLLMAMFGWGAVIYVDFRHTPADTLDVYVIGKQWMWKLQQPNGLREINELHVPVNRNVRLVMASEDVIHDFSVPAFRVKMDVVPATTTPCGSADEGRPLSFLLLAVLRYKSRHHGRLGHRHGAGRICCLARRKYRDGRSRCRLRRGGFPSSSGLACTVIAENLILGNQTLGRLGITG